jgi:hypothetical protein
VSSKKQPKKLSKIKSEKTVPVSFFSRKLTEGQREWTPREQETYAVVEALRKWESWIGFRRVTVLTDHRAIVNWHTEMLESPSGPTGRRGRWHEFLGKFKLEIVYVPGKDNTAADALSRWAYAASEAINDLTRHGSARDAAEVAEMEEREAKEREASIFSVRIAASDEIIDVLATELQESTSFVNPVEADADDSASPPDRFSFAAPGTGKSNWFQRYGQHARQGKEPSRKSPPRREVGPDDQPPEGQNFEQGREQTDDEASESGESEASAASDEEIVEAPPGSVRNPDWTQWYQKCPTWGETWNDLDSSEKWPIGYKVVGRQMFLNMKKCVPSALQHDLIRLVYEQKGHNGFERT